MNVKLSRIAHFASWAVAVCAMVAVAIEYDSLPEVLPLSRWATTPKSVLMALRVPAINLLTMGLVEVLLPPLRRIEDSPRAEAVVSVLLATAAVKAALESAGLLLLPASPAWTLPPLVIALSAGLGTAGLLGRKLFEPPFARRVKSTPRETAVAAALGIGILALELPLLLR